MKVLNCAWMGWVRQQPETLREDYRKNYTMGLNAFTHMLAYILVEAICPSLFVADDFQVRAADPVAKCHNRIVTAICQGVVPAVRKDLKRMGLRCEEMELYPKVCGPQATA